MQVQPRPDINFSGDRSELNTLVTQSHDIARKILPTLSSHGIPVTPTNYRLWYEYYTGMFTALNETLDRLTKEGVEFTPELTESLYRRFFSLEATENHSRAVGQAGERLKAMAGDIVQTLTVSKDQSYNYSQSLDNHIKNVTESEDVVSLRAILAVIVDQTAAVMKAQGQLQDKLEQAQTELNRLQDEMRRQEGLALTDELTGLANRRAFNVKLSEETARSRRYGGNVSLILMDLDNFKTINDRYGHLIGDRVLVVTAKTIRLAIRGMDFVGRYGGEEFAVICPQTDLEGARIVAQRLQEAIDHTQFTVKGVPVSITISAGVSQLAEDDRVHDLIDRADQALYKAKRTGKNKVCTELDLEVGLESAQCSA